jgi:hypothetical protein
MANHLKKSATVPMVKQAVRMEPKLWACCGLSGVDKGKFVRVAVKKMLLEMYPYLKNRSDIGWSECGVYGVAPAYNK